MADSEHDQAEENTRVLVQKLDAVGWGLFFVWIGIAFLANIGWGAGLLGVGVIALGVQGARRRFGLPFEPFGLVIGVVFALWGVWELLNFELGEAPVPGSLVPILFIVVGVVIVVSALLRKPRH